MCMSVLEGGIYFDELAGLPPRHLALLMLGLLLALLGAISMGVAGFVAGAARGGGCCCRAGQACSGTAAAGACLPCPVAC